MEIVAIPFTIPFRYISVFLEVDRKKKFTQEEAKRVAEICVKGFG